MKLIIQNILYRVIMFLLRKQLIQNAEVVCGKTKYTRTNSIEIKSVSSS